MKPAARRITLVLLALLTWATTTSAEDTSSKINVSNAWARATVPSAKNGALSEIPSVELSFATTAGCERSDVI
jgi:hypothetical protein